MSRTGEMRQRLALGAVLFFIGTFAQPIPSRADSPEDILIIVNKNVMEKGVTLDDVRDIFLKKRTRWDKSGKAVPVNASKNSKLRNEFISRVLEMTPNEEIAYWQARKIKNGVDPPVSFANNQKAVFHLKGAISYVYRSELLQNVAVILFVLPAE